ncbi:MAG: tetratricopeptide repeat protein, partial [Helicobacter sp.]|nr:tetratricopeptide repeat protein [Helicobacter sp.]
MNTAKSLHNKNIEGARYLLAKDYQNAANAFSDVLKADPNNAGALAGVAALLYSTGNGRAAYGYVQKAVQNDPRNVPQLGLAITIADKLGIFEDVKRYATKAYKLAPKAAAGIKAYLLYLQHTTEAHEIERLAHELLALDKSAEARLIAGTALEMIGKTIEAIRS